MKKIIAIMLVLSMVAAFAACADSNETSKPESSVAESSVAVESSAAESSEDSSAAEVAVMSYEEYLAAEVGVNVVVETYVQANQSWWDNKITLYCQSEEGGVFVYNCECSEDDSKLLVPGTKIRVSGSKADFNGEIEITEATFEIVEGDTYVAEATDLTDKLGTDELINHMNKLAAFKGLTVKAVEYKNGEPGDDIYVTFTKDDADFNFCVEVYLTGVDSDVYKAVGELKEGDVVDVEAFLYWYESANPHITSITAAQ